MTDQVVEQVVANMQQEKAVSEWKENQVEPETPELKPGEAVEAAKDILGIVEPAENPSRPAGPMPSPQQAYVEQAVGQLQQVEANLMGHAQQLDAYINSPEFQQLEQMNPGEAAKQLQQAQQMRYQLDAEYQGMQQQAGQVYAAEMETRINAVFQEVPGWHDRNVAIREGNEMLQHFAQQGYSAGQIQAAMLQSPQAARAAWEHWQEEKGASPRGANLRGGAPMRMNRADRAFATAKRNHRSRGRRGATDSVKIAAKALRNLGLA